MEVNKFKAAILDLDGVITQTASLHAKAWKQVFDEYNDVRLTQGEEIFTPFDIVKDYRRYVDGKPRYDGVSSFLEARTIELPFGSSDDKPGWKTVCAIGNRKNKLFNKLLNKEGAVVFEDAELKLRQWKQMGYRLAVVSSSKNCRGILKSVGLETLFDVLVDGVVAEEKHLAGKPKPDTFQYACQQLGVDVHSSIMFEDAEAGVQAGQSGHFGLVVGVARNYQNTALIHHGADITIDSFEEIQLNGKGEYHVCSRCLPSALSCFDRILKDNRQKQLILFLDYDGTLTPIVDDPEKAFLSEPMRSLLKRMSQMIPVGIISGRDLKTVQNFVNLDPLVYAGSHGFDIQLSDGSRVQFDSAKKVLPALDKSEKKLQKKLDSIEGVKIERKQFAIAVHYRHVNENEVPQVIKIVTRIGSHYSGLRMKRGKMIVELQPDIDWHKGKAVQWLLDRLDIDKNNVLPVYIGDDVTDEDAFAALQLNGIGILVGDHDGNTAARFRLNDVNKTARFLEKCIQELKK